MNRMEDDEDLLDQDDNNLAEDDNAQIDEVEEPAEDPLLLAVDDLEGRVVAALDDVKLHPGVHDPASGVSSIHEEFAVLLRPVLEVAAHTGPSVARTYFRGTNDGLDDAVEDVYERLVSDLVLPVLLEMAQSDQVAAKRGAALEFFRSYWKETQKAGSWLDGTAPPTSSVAGPYGNGSTSSHQRHRHDQGQALPRPVQMRRKEKRLAREGEILRYWLQAAIACMTPGVFTAQAAEDATSARGVLAASASLRPALRHIVQRIKAADDRGANRIYTPVMKLTESVLSKLLLASESLGGTPENLMASCIKYVEIIVLCCSIKPQDPVAKRRGAAATTPQEDFSLGDLPEGHPVITRESLESVADYAFTILKGLTLMGGQVKIDANTLSSVMMASGGSPAQQVVNILKPAALAYLEIETNFPSVSTGEGSDNVNLETNLDRSSIDFDFRLGAKSYSVAINAIAALAIHRPGFFKESSICLARRAIHPPAAEDAPSFQLKPVSIKALTSQIKSSCLTLLRNPLSVSTNASPFLHKALLSFEMEVQADKALAMAKQAHSLKTAGRAARNRASVYYEWEATTATGDGSRSSKRQRETDDALAKMRAAKAARGLGSGIQLPTSMSEAVDLVMANLEHLPSKRPPSAKNAKPRKVPVTLEFFVDAILTNGASLSQEEGKWYERDGGSAWEIHMEDQENRFQPNAKLVETMELMKRDYQDETEDVQKKRKLFEEQAENASADAFGRILSNAMNSRSDRLADFGRSIASRLAFTLRKVSPMTSDATPIIAAKAGISKVVQDSEQQQKLKDFVDIYPLAASGLSFDSSVVRPDHSKSEKNPSIALQFLDEALLQQESSPDDPYCHDLYDLALDTHFAVAVNASFVANDKPNDLEKKKMATQAVSGLQRDLPLLPRLTSASISQLASLCDIEAISKKAIEASKKTAQESIAEAAAIHAAKVAAEKRATAALIILRDIAYRRDTEERTVAVECLTGLATGRLSSVAGIQDKALKVVINMCFPRSEALAKTICDAATMEIEVASENAISLYDEIQKANSEAVQKETKKNPLHPSSDTEKQAMDRLRKPTLLFMAVCLRKTDMISALFKAGSAEKADVLSKTIRANMKMLARNAATKHGAASLAFDVAGMSTSPEIPLLLSFLENLMASPDHDLIDACLKIQDSKAGEDGKKDPRFLIPVLPSINRVELVKMLPDYVMAEDSVFLDALIKMGSRVALHALLFREEPDESAPSLNGMTLCEQLVYLHKLDFAEAGIPQKRYLSCIKLCLEEDEIYNDRVVQSALDQISGVFLTGSEKLPLAFMRTCILVCSKHESLHSWIAQVLLPRLIDGKIYEDSRQWEGWMRACHLLESGESGVGASETLKKLPQEQLLQYQAKWLGKNART